MNTFVIKKLGEVLAFARVENEVLDKTNTVLAAVLGEEVVMDIMEKNKVHAAEIEKIATDANIFDKVNPQAEETAKKLHAMGDIYIGSAWSDATEVLEWLSFFHGAAEAHWGLVKGESETLKSDPLMLLADEAVNFHHDTLDAITSELQSEGQAKA